MKTTKILIVTRWNQIKVGDNVRFKNRRGEYVYDCITQIDEQKNILKGNNNNLYLYSLEIIVQPKYIAKFKEWYDDGLNAIREIEFNSDIEPTEYFWNLYRNSNIDLISITPVK